MQNTIPEKDFFNKLWEYFIQHSNQRMQLINFYIVLETFLFTGMFTIKEDKQNYKIICIVISIAVIFFSFIFYNLDRRTKDLIKNCEEAIKKAEKKYRKEVGESMMILSLEEEETYRQCMRGMLPFSYTTSFELMFSFFGLLGILSLIYSAKI